VATHSFYAQKTLQQETPSVGLGKILGNTRIPLLLLQGGTVVGGGDGPLSPTNSTFFALWQTTRLRVPHGGSKRIVGPSPVHIQNQLDDT
jgi:hypothetical protein